MSSKYDGLFDDADIVSGGVKRLVIPRNDSDYKMGKSRDGEPESQQQPSSPATGEASTSSTTRSESSSPPLVPGQKTLVGLLEEGCRKLYSISPEYKTIEIEDPSGDLTKTKYQIQCFVNGTAGRLGTAISMKVKLGKHMAAGNVLRQIVADGMHKSFNIPGNTEAEAIEYINSLMPELNNTLPEASPIVINFIGKLNEICQKNKLSTPNYTDEPAEADGIFRVSCQIGKRRTGASARTKKQAKNQAAYDMLSDVEHLIVNTNLDETQAILLGTFDPDAPLPEDSQVSTPSPTYDLSYGDDLVDGERSEMFKEKVRAWIRRNDHKGSEEFLGQLLDGTVQFMKEFFINFSYEFTAYSNEDVNGCMQGFIAFHDYKGSPTRTFHGVGKTEKDCRDAAALNVIKFVDVSIEPEFGVDREDD